MIYRFAPGDRVRSRDQWAMTGEITSCVPGNGSFPWYFVRWDDGSEGRYTDDQIEAD